MTAQGMMLRNMALVGSTAPSIMPKEHRPAFEAGVKILFSKWTALQLGVMNEWGGPNSKEKAEGIMEEAVEWFYKRKDHEMQDLADLLDQCISEDFYIQAEDDSPYQLARTLVNMHNQVAQGNYSYIERLQAMPSAATGASQRDQAQGEDSSSSSEDEGDSDEEMGDAAMDVDDPAPREPPKPRGPVIDEDGFQLVQRKGRGRR